MSKTLHVDGRDWDQLDLRGEDRVRFFQGMCTGNVEALEEGGWMRTCILSPKGRVLAVCQVVRSPDRLRILAEGGLGESIAELLERHIIADDVDIEPVSAPLHWVWPDREAVWTAPAIAEPPPEPVASASEVETRRIEAGLPRYGVDVTADNFPFESLLSRLIDYEKGCYVGQEPVARVRSRGRPNKLLCGLAVEGPEPVAVGAAVERPGPGPGRIGVVTSAAQSPDFGTIALAYLGREHGVPGTEVEVAGRPARVVELPFG